MKRFAPLLLFALLLFSCIPLRIAPQIKDNKIVMGKRFKKGLPKKYVFVFEDTKAADQFYNYINTKFNLQDYYVDVQVPFEIEEREYYLSFYEVEIADKALNLFPLLADVAVNVALGNEDFENYVATTENSTVRQGNYYIAIEVFSETEKDCLSEKYSNRPAVLTYLRELKGEYYSTYNYNEVVFKN